jgi:aminoglycoside N3'-acetyltransferase
MAGRARKAVRRSLQRLLYSIDRRSLVRAFRRLGMQRGDTVCVHSSLKSLGFISGGPNEVIEALIETVGPEGGIMMPSFPLTGSMAGYLDGGELFDVRVTTSRSGALTEIFRQRDDVSRSLHPTNPVAAWGASAERLLRGHENSATPYGYATPYGRLVEEERGCVLMMGTHIHSLLHHLQERVDFPNLFLADERTARFVDYDGIQREIRTRVMRPKVPYFIAIPPATGDDPDWAILHDFALMFPRTRDAEVRELGYRFDGYPGLWSRRSKLQQAGILASTRIGRGEIGLLHVGPFIRIVEPELRELIGRYHDFYDVDAIVARGLRYG